MADSRFVAEQARAMVTVNGVNVMEFNQNGNAYMLYAGGTLTTPNLTATSTVTAGNVNGNNFNTTSDIRLKENVEDIKAPIEKVKGLRGVFYSMKGDDKTHVGMIAQETADVLPEAVSRRDDGYLGIEYGNVVGLLVEAIKDQQRQIEDLQATVKALMK